MNDTSFTIKEAAELTGVSQHTLRYYEKIGLLAPVARSGSGHRRYDDDDLYWVRIFTILRDTGMPIRRMLAFVELDKGGDSTIDERRALLEEHRLEVVRRIEDLQRSLGTIDAKIAHYQDISNSRIRRADAVVPDA